LLFWGKFRTTKNIFFTLNVSFCEKNNFFREKLLHLAFFCDIKYNEHTGGFSFKTRFSPAVAPQISQKKKNI